jgi:hypothetical protein
MAKITLSGGDFGGLEVDSNEFKDNKLTKTDSNGNDWVYDSSLSVGGDRAELSQFIPVSEVK